MHNIDILKQLVFKGVDEKKIEITQEVSDRISKELTVIEQNDLADLFIICTRIAEICRENQIVTSFGYSTSTNSYICYCLNITNIDPIAENLPFEIFFIENQNKTNLGIQLAKGFQTKVLDILEFKYPEYHYYKIAFGNNTKLKYSQIEYNNKTYKIHPTYFYISKTELKQNVIIQDGIKYVFINNILRSNKYYKSISIVENIYLGQIQELVEVIGYQYHPNNINLNDVNVFQTFQNSEIEKIFGFDIIIYKLIFMHFKPKSLNDLAIARAVYMPNNLHYVDPLKEYNGKIDFPFEKKDLTIYKIFKETKGMLVFSETFLYLFDYFIGLTLEDAEKIRRECLEEKDFIPLTKLIFKNKIKTPFDFSEIISVMLYFENRLYISKPKGKFLTDAIISYWAAYYKLYFFKEFVNIFCKDEIEKK
jgi:DNA polymerase-3 subunit alpha